MSKEETPPGGGLLSKVVRFVRNPTVNWTDLDSIDADRESQYSKQMLKEMIERKRRNDFVRRREFDQLRKLRQRDALSGQRVEDPAARPSFFQSSLTSPDDRAGTIKKIDEIEAQMSMQWWKSKQNPDSGSEPATQPPADAPDSGRPVRAAPVELGEQDQIPAPNAFAPTAPMSLPGPLTPATPLFADDNMEKARATFGNTAQPMTAPPAAPVAPALATFVHEPDLEEAAILFANDDPAGAEAGLLDLLEQHSGDAPERLLDFWMTLFDLYRATGQQDRFDAQAITFAARFDRSAPLWYSLPASLGLQVDEPKESAAPVRRDYSWNAPPTLTVQSAAALQAALGRAASPWTMTWTRITAIDPGAVSALANEFTRWADLDVQIVFVGVERLLSLLESKTQSGDREQDEEWWRLRMAMLRFMGRPDEFEMVALDYCVTYEVSPPSWQAPRCSYRDDADTQPATQGPGSRPAWLDSVPLEGDPSIPAPLMGPEGLVGVIESDATAALAEVAQYAHPGMPLQVRCERLIRMDFLAAGSVLNWAADQQAQGRSVQFLNLHRLAAVFFNVVGINEHAMIVARKD